MPQQTGLDNFAARGLAEHCASGFVGTERDQGTGNPKKGGKGPQLGKGPALFLYFSFFFDSDAVQLHDCE